VIPENVHFALPGTLRRDAEAVGAGGARGTAGRPGG
jgi:hypothetical protein